MQRTISESGNIIIICSLGRCVPSARSGTAVLLSQGMAWLFRGFKQFVHSCHQQPAFLFCQLLWVSVVAFMWISSAPLTVVVLFWASLFTWIRSHFTVLCHCLSLYLFLRQVNDILCICICIAVTLSVSIICVLFCLCLWYGAFISIY